MRRTKSELQLKYFKKLITSQNILIMITLFQNIPYDTVKFNWNVYMTYHNHNIQMTFCKIKKLGISKKYLKI